MHDARPVVGENGRPVRMAEPLWDRKTHEALVEKTAPKRGGSRAPKGPRLLSGIAFCGNCGEKLQVVGRRAEIGFGYGCTARVRGIRSSQDCKPAPSIGIAALDAMTGEWFTQYGAGDEMKRVYDPGTGHASQIAELEATRDRLRGGRFFARVVRKKARRCPNDIFSMIPVLAAPTLDEIRSVNQDLARILIRTQLGYWHQTEDIAREGVSIPLRYRARIGLGAFFQDRSIQIALIPFLGVIFSAILLFFPHPK